MVSIPLNVAVIGAGMSCQVFHAPLIQALPEQFKLHTVLERRATPEKSVAREKYGSGIKVVNTIEEVVKDAEVDVVVITTSNESHFSLARTALNAGKHVVVEKPLTPTSTEALQLATLAKDKGLVLATYQNRRWDSDFLTVRELIEQGKLGEVVEFESHFDRFRPVPKGGWRESAGEARGVLYDLGSHLIDQALVLFGSPQSVTGFVQNSRQAGDLSVDDSFTVHLHYPPTTAPVSRNLPLTVTLRASVLSLLTPPLRYIVKGTAGSFVKHYLDVQEGQSKEGIAPTADGFGVEPEDARGFLTTLQDGKEVTSRVTSKAGVYLDFYRNVADAITGKAPLAVTPESAAQTIKIIELAAASSKEGRTLLVA